MLFRWCWKSKKVPTASLTLFTYEADTGEYSKAIQIPRIIAICFQSAINWPRMKNRWLSWKILSPSIKADQCQRKDKLYRTIGRKKHIYITR